MAEISGGDKLERALAEMAEHLQGAGTLKVGFLRGAVYPDGTPVAAVAAWNNWGTGTAPPRPFFSNMVRDKSDTWGPAIAGLLPANGYDGRKVLQLAGQGIEAQLKNAIIEMNSPPNAPSTLRKKKGTKPLVDTGHMLNSTGHVVE